GREQGRVDDDVAPGQQSAAQTAPDQREIQDPDGIRPQLLEPTGEVSRVNDLLRGQTAGGSEDRSLGQPETHLATGQAPEPRQQGDQQNRGVRIDERAPTVGRGRKTPAAQGGKADDARHGSFQAANVLTVWVGWLDEPWPPPPTGRPYPRTSSQLG